MSPIQPIRGYFIPLDSFEYILKVKPHCFKLFWQLERRAASRARASAGNRIAARMPIIAITTNNSISVKPFWYFIFSLLFLTQPVPNIPALNAIHIESCTRTSRSARTNQSLALHSSSYFCYLSFPKDVATEIFKKKLLPILCLQNNPLLRTYNMILSNFSRITAIVPVQLRCESHLSSEKVLCQDKIIEFIIYIKGNRVIQ